MEPISTKEHRFVMRGKVSLRVTKRFLVLPPTDMGTMLDDGWELHTFQSPFILTKMFEQDPEQDPIAKQMLKESNGR